MLEIADLAQMKALVGREVAVSDWVELTQQRIDAFADATGDHQWIHVDPARSRRDSPYGGTVAHGFLTLALLPAMMNSTLRMPDVKVGINYGVNKVRFPAPVPAGSRLRAHFRVLAVSDIPGGAQIVWDVSVEREGSAKPVCVAEYLLRRYP